MKILTRHWVGIAIGVILIALDIIFFLNQKVFYFLLGIAVLIAAAPFITTLVIEVGREKAKEEMFLEFARSLVESVKVGTPISKSIIQMKNKDFGVLSPNISKLANQIAIGIPVRQAFKVFASDVNNKVVSRSIALITEAEESGGQISMILESTAKSVSEIEDVKKERRSSTYNLVMEGYVIFLIFLVIMLAVQIKFIPLMVKTISEAGAGMVGAGAGLGAGLPQVQTTGSIESLGAMFLVLIIVQGFFAGLVIGKLSEGTVKAGVKHSIILTAIAYLITTGAQAFAAS